MTKFGQVISYDEQTGMATIEYARPDACGHCGGCAAASHRGTITLPADCAPGQWVRVELPESRFLQAIALAYLLPLVLFLAGLGLGFLLGGGGDGWTLLGGAAGLGLSLLTLRLSNRRIAGRQDWTPHVAAVYEQKPSMEEIGCDGTPTAFKR